MKIALIGYGKMGQAIEKIAQDRGHQISAIYRSANRSDLSSLTKEKADVAIEFSEPTSAYQNVKQCVANGVPIVCGTTGWLEHEAEIHELVKKTNGAYFYASNFSIGVNLFFKLNEKLAEMMNRFTDYNVEMEEIHHVHKKDAPSGTAITLAEGILKNLDRKKKWVLNGLAEPNELRLVAKRVGEIPGTHSVLYHSSIDMIEITHTAQTRYGFALGSVVAAEWLADKKGVFGMNDMLNL